MITFAQHAPCPFFSVEQDSLVVGGEPVTKIVERIGRTPAYVYDRGAITERVRAVRAAIPEAFELHYAVKANPMPDVVAHLASLVDGLDVASGGELEVALASSRIAPADVSFAGPGKSGAELEAAVRAGILVNVESPTELARLARIGREHGVKPRVALRVNPDFELKTSGMKMAGGPKQFGIDAEQVPAVLAGADLRAVAFEGFHIFAGSQNLRSDAIQEAQSKSLDLAIELARHAPAPVRVLNLGGGFGIPYFPREQALDLEAVGVGMRAIAERAASVLPGTQLVIELGRYLVGEAGLYVCRVVDRKVSRGHVFLVTDGGLHHHLAASGNFGQVVRKNYPVVVANRVQGGAREIASVVGPLCTPLDLLASSMELARADVGDLIAVFQSGAYGLTASPLGFLSHPAPAEALVG
jgi:diaminopimelate decarboxylase